MPKIESYLDAMSPMDKMTEEDEMGEVESGEETGDIADSAGMIENMVKSGELVSGVGGGAGTLTLPLDDHEGLTEEDTDNRVTMVVSGMVNKNDGNVVSVVVDEVSVIHGKCVEKDTMPVEGRKGIK